MSGRCTGYPRHSCRATNGYAKAKMRAWMCKKCQEKRTKVWQVKNI